MKNQNIFKRIGRNKKPSVLNIEKEFSKPIYRRLTELSVLIFLFLVIVGPIVNIISNVVDNVGIIRNGLFEDELMGDLQWEDMKSSLWQSFSIAGIAVLLDILIGFPIAVILARNDFRGK
jgi:ABC-type Fe3+ transport system permease subunit